MTATIADTTVKTPQPTRPVEEWAPYFAAPPVSSHIEGCSHPFCTWLELAVAGMDAV